MIRFCSLSVEASGADDGSRTRLTDAEKPLIIARIQATEKQSRRKVLEFPFQDLSPIPTGFKPRR